MSLWTVSNWQQICRGPLLTATCILWKQKYGNISITYLIWHFGNWNIFSLNSISGFNVSKELLFSTGSSFPRCPDGLWQEKSKYQTLSACWVWTYHLVTAWENVLDYLLLRETLWMHTHSQQMELYIPAYISDKWMDRWTKILISTTLIYIVSVTIKLCGNPLFNTGYILNYSVVIKLCCVWGNKK